MRAEQDIFEKQVMNAFKRGRRLSERRRHLRPGMWRLLRLLRRWDFFMAEQEWAESSAASWSERANTTARARVRLAAERKRDKARARQHRFEEEADRVLRKIERLEARLFGEVDGGVL